MVESRPFDAADSAGQVQRKAEARTVLLYTAGRGTFDAIEKCCAAFVLLLRSVCAFTAQ